MKIPYIGQGFWLIKKEDAYDVFKNGYETGYRHFDTAIVYRNEEEIGKAINDLKLDRSKIWLTSKIPAEIKTYEGAKEAILSSLKSLNTPYLDLMLILAPKPWALMLLPGPRFHKGNREVFRALIDAKKEGLVKNIGVSNFNINDIKNLLDYSDEKIFANQVQIHIGLVPKKLINFCKEHDILVEAYSPIGTGRLLNNKKIVEIAKKYNVSPAQLAIKYDLDLGVIPLPRSKSKKHLEENLKLDFDISKEDKEILDKIKCL